MVDELASEGDDCRVVTTNADGRTSFVAGTVRRLSGAVVHYCRRVRGGLFAPWALVQSVAESRTCSLIYVWGVFVWLLPVMVLVARFRDVPLVVAPGGMLYGGAIARHKRRKTAFLGLLRALGIEERAVFHVTAESEIASVTRFFPSARCVNVPHGVDHCDVPRNPAKGRYLLFLGRIDPIKRIEIIIRAYAAASRGLENSTRLVIAGSGDTRYLAKLESLAREVAAGMDVDFHGYVEGQQKSELLASARAVILCSRSENFGLVIAEALAAGTPVIVTTTTPWGMVEEKGVGWCVDDSEHAIAEAMRAALFLSNDQLTELSRRAKEWMRQDHLWQSIAARIREAFQAEIDRAAKKI